MRSSVRHRNLSPMSATNLLMLFVVLCGVIPAQQTGQKPSPVRAPARKSTSKPAATPKPQPKIWINTATTDGVITGHTTDPNHMVRITVSKEGGEVKTEPEWPLPSGDFTIPVILLKPGWVVQAWVIDGSAELAHSPAKPVTELDDDPPSALTRSTQPASPQAEASRLAPAAAPLVPASKKPGSTASSSICQGGNLDTEAKLELSNDDTEIHGNTSKFAAGQVLVCVNGKPRLIQDTGDSDSISGSLNRFAFNVTLATAPALKRNDRVLVALESLQGKRATIEGTVGPAKNVEAQAKPCDKAANGDKTIVTDALYPGAQEITGSVPVSSGKVSVCVGEAQVEIAAGPLPAKEKGSPSYATTLPITSSKLDLLLKDAVKKADTVRIVLTDGDKPPLTKDVAIAPPKVSRVRLRSVPKEGDTKMIVDVDPPPVGSTADATTALNLSVFVNGDGATLQNGKGSDIQTQPVDASGETGITLKNAIDGGDCVVVVEHAGEVLPSDIKFDKLLCAAKNEQPKILPETTRDYSQSYQFLARSVFDWGRARGHMAAGGLFSFDNSNFSSESIFLAFNMARNWIWGGPYREYDENGKLAEYGQKNGHPVTEKYKHFMLETFFDARLTSLPVAACTTSSTKNPNTQSAFKFSSSGNTGSAGNNSSSSSAPSTCPNMVDTFISTRKSASLGTGVYVPYLAPTWFYTPRPYAFSFGPVAKIGFDTPVGDVQSGSTVANNHSFYTNFGFGSRFGLYRMSSSTNVAPELEDYVDVVMGRYSNFDVSPLTGIRYARPWRVGIEGYLKVPTTPFLLGFGANIHQNFGLSNSKTVDNARDSLQFLFGAKFDVGKLFAKIGTLK